MDESTVERLQALLTAATNVNDWTPLPPEVAASLALVRSANARQRLPVLEPRFTELSWMNRAAVAASRPDPYFVPAVLQILQQASSYRSGELAGRLLVQHSPFLTRETLTSALEDWRANDQCRQAAEMPALAVSVFHGTAHLGATREEVFREFLAAVRSLEGEGDYYSYPALDTAIQNARQR